MFIENCRALVLRRGVHHYVASRIYPLLQVTFVVVGRIATGLLAVKDRDKTHRIAGFDLYHTHHNSVVPLRPDTPNQ